MDSLNKDIILKLYKTHISMLQIISNYKFSVGINDKTVMKSMGSVLPHTPYLFDIQYQQ